MSSNYVQMITFNSSALNYNWVAIVSFKKPHNQQKNLNSSSVPVGSFNTNFCFIYDVYHQEFTKVQKIKIYSK